MSLYDLSTAAQDRVHLQGTPIAFSAALDRVALVREERGESEIRRRVVVETLPEQQRLEVASSDSVPVRALSKREAGGGPPAVWRGQLGRPTAPRSADGFQQTTDYQPVLPDMLFDPALTVGVSVLLRPDGQFLRQELVAFDVGGTGAGRVLIAADELPAIHIFDHPNGNLPTVGIRGFDPREDYAVIDIVVNDATSGGLAAWFAGADYAALQESGATTLDGPTSGQHLVFSRIANSSDGSHSDIILTATATGPLARRAT